MSEKPPQRGKGAPRKYEEPIDQRLNLTLTASMKAELARRAKETGTSPSEIIRRALEGSSQTDATDVAAELRKLREELLAALPSVKKFQPSAIKIYRIAEEVNAGSWREAIEENHELYSGLDLLNWQDGDFLLVVSQAEGDCLTGDGIFPGDLVHIRPMQPEPGDIVLAGGQDDATRAFVTLKHWHPRGKDVVELRDSNPTCENRTITAHIDRVEVEGVVINAVRRDIRKTGTKKRNGQAKGKRA